ncbi:uncharacterized protein LOC128679980 [Plodia interpunctella]|uniref:uncharacterized protein LOC128679980 n=1 Tax=Plodia interpunctella TaxID=58824 RepID=UPI0023681D1D|nr:uncharacterized protein LOC128679980 [Plodia interpunctella]
MPHPPAPASNLEPLVPMLALAVYVACVGGTGALVNCTLLATLFKSARNGVYSIITQLAIADFGLIGVCLIQMWSSNAKNWQFGSIACSAYQGLRVFTTTVSTYLIVTIALHTLATINLEEKAAMKRNRRKLQDENEEIRTSRHSLVANSDSSTPPRTMNVDYRVIDTSVPVAPPTTFVWVLGFSLSIPEFVLATVVHVDREVLCTSVDTNHQANMHTLLAVFETFLPIIIMCVTGILVIKKLKSKKSIMVVWPDSMSALKLSIWLIGTYSVFCIPRSVTSIYNIYASSTSESTSEISPIELTPKSYEIAMISLCCGAAYLAATIIRPLLCIFLLPRLKKVICKNCKDVDNNINNV